MGQYYTAVTIDKEGKMTVYSLQSKTWRENEENWREYNGIKLMEHSWVGNSFTDFFSKLIYKNPMKVGWVGDYANTEDGSAHEAITNELLEKIGNTPEIDFEKTRRVGFRGKYLINHTKRCYIPLDDYAYRKNKWIVYPISLLTAVGNGLGGGDYHGRDSELVGSYAFDEISIDNEIPKDFFEDYIPEFRE